MKILTVVVDLAKGGTQRAAQVFAEAYASQGHDSRILALYGLGSRYEEIKDYIPVWESINPLNSKAIENWGPELVHIHSHGPKKEDIDLLIQSCNKAKIIETNVFSVPSEWSESVDVSFQLSHWAQWLYNLRGGHKFKSAIVPNPIKVNSFKIADAKDVALFKKEYSIPQDAFVIGRIGQTSPNKWSPVIIDVFNNICRTIPNTYLLLINPPEIILEEANRSSYRDQIVHIPSIFGDENLSIAYSAMDVMLHIATRGESFGMVFPECILCGTPVVALSTPWADNSQIEVIGNRKGGFIVNNKKNLAKTIADLYHNRLEYDPEIGIEHVQKYSHIRASEQAINCSIATKDEDLQLSAKSILKNSLDKPNFLTVLFIGFNSIFFKDLTIYTSGYKGMKDMLRSAFSFVGRSLINRKANN